MDLKRIGYGLNPVAGCVKAVMNLKILKKGREFLPLLINYLHFKKSSVPWRYIVKLKIGDC
jgi:hypothetical protein